MFLWPCRSILLQRSFPKEIVNDGCLPINTRLQILLFLRHITLLLLPKSVDIFTTVPVFTLIGLDVLADRNHELGVVLQVLSLWYRTYIENPVRFMNNIRRSFFSMNHSLWMSIIVIIIHHIRSTWMYWFHFMTQSLKVLVLYIWFMWPRWTRRARRRMKTWYEIRLDLFWQCYFLSCGTGKKFIFYSILWSKWSHSMTKSILVWFHI